MSALNPIIVGAAVLASVISGAANAATPTDAFCENSPFVPFGQLIRDAKAYEGKRVQTYGVLRSDAKEYTSIMENETSTVYAMVDGDAISQAYADKHQLPSRNNRADFLADYRDKLRAARGKNAVLDMSQLGNYRQEVLMCGRISKANRGYRFFSDDAVLKKSYLLRGRRRTRGARPTR